MSHATNRTVNRRELLGAAGAGAATMLPGADHGATAHAPELSLEIIPERLRHIPLMRLAPEPQADPDATVADITDAFRQFSATLSDTQRDKLLFPLDGVERTTGRDTSLTPAFCAVLIWCKPPWGLSLGELTYEQRAACEAFLLAALGPTGYDTVTLTRNRQHLLGVLEDSGHTLAIEAASTFVPGRTFADLRGLVAALEANGAALPPETIAAAAIGGLDPSWDDWHWPPPGLAERWRQFEQYAIAIFGQPGNDTWGLRFEGHHVSINLTFVLDGAHWQVHGTPLFTGAFPAIVPPPAAAPGLNNPLTWQQGQSRGLSLIRGVRKFWSAMPERQRGAAHRPAESFRQEPPLRNETPGGPMLVTLDTDPDTTRLKQGPHLAVNAAALSADARRRLTALYDELLSIMHPAVAAPYRRRLDVAVHAGSVVATWAGGDLNDQGSQHSSSIAVGPLLVELLQTPGYSVTSPQMPWSNHLHVMLRDLESPIWGSPLSAHQHRDHATPSP